MGLNDILLTPSLLTSLYADVLVNDIATAVPKPSITPHMGKNEKHILLIISTAGIDFLSDSDLLFLQTILTPCKLTMADVALINWKKKKKNYEEILTDFKSRHIILFDVSPEQFGLPLNFPHFQVQEFNKQLYLFAPSLKDIQKDVSAKTSFWNALKIFFNLKGK